MTCDTPASKEVGGDVLWGKKCWDIKKIAIFIKKNKDDCMKDMERILITGKKSLLAKHFEALFGDKYDLRFLTSHPTEENDFYWSPMEDEIDPVALDGVDHILHLTGAILMPNSKSVKERDVLLTYRVSSIALIGRMLMARGQKIKSIVTASSYYYYGTTYSPYIYTEHHKAGSDYYAQLNQAAEEESYILEVEKLAERSVYPRFGNILCEDRGILPLISIGSPCGLAISYGLGRQIIPWVHITDACRTLDYIIEHPKMVGPYNCVAPGWITYREIAENCAKIRNGKVLPVHVPSSIMKAKYGKYTDFILRSKRISMKRLLNSGFDFVFPDFISAVMDIYLDE